MFQTGLFEYDESKLEELGWDPLWETDKPHWENSWPVLEKTAIAEGRIVHRQTIIESEDDEFYGKDMVGQYRNFIKKVDSEEIHSIDEAAFKIPTVEDVGGTDHLSDDQFRMHIEKLVREARPVIELAHTRINKLERHCGADDSSTPDVDEGMSINVDTLIDPRG